MADKTPIEWADATVNAVNGCSIHSPGCTNCYAMKLAGTRLRNHPSREGLTQQTKAGPVWTGEVRLSESQLVQPLHWKRPRRIFWNAHGDLFHEAVPDAWIDLVFALCALTPQHTHMILTKRSARMRDYMEKRWADEWANEVGGVRTTAAVNAIFRQNWRYNWGYCGSTSTGITTTGRGTGAREPGMLRRLSDGGVERLWFDSEGGETWHRCGDEYAARLPVWAAHETEFGWGLKMWPLPNVWLGVSVEDDERRARIVDLAQTPAAVRFVSGEPLLTGLSLTDIPLDGGEDEHGIQWLFNALTGEQYFIGDDGHNYSGDGPDMHPLDWVIAGGESGPGARPMHPDWARSLRDQCQEAGVPFFFKQWGEWASVSEVEGPGAHHHFPDGATVRRVGKTRAGRMLDGREWSEFPA